MQPSVPTSPLMWNRDAATRQLQSADAQGTYTENVVFTPAQRRRAFRGRLVFLAWHAGAMYGAYRLTRLVVGAK